MRIKNKQLALLIHFLWYFEMYPLIGWIWVEILERLRKQALKQALEILLFGSEQRFPIDFSLKTFFFFGKEHLSPMFSSVAEISQLLLVHLSVDDVHIVVCNDTLTILMVVECVENTALVQMHQLVERDF